jgi:hypothetical protein
MPVPAEAFSRSAETGVAARPDAQYMPSGDALKQEKNRIEGAGGKRFGLIYIKPRGCGADRRSAPAERAGEAMQKLQRRNNEEIPAARQRCMVRMGRLELPSRSTGF